MSGLNPVGDDSQDWTTDDEDSTLPELLPIVPNPSGRGLSNMASAGRTETDPSYLGAIDTEDDDDEEDEDYTEDSDDDEIDIDYTVFAENDDVEPESPDVESEIGGDEGQPGGEVDVDGIPTESRATRARRAAAEARARTAATQNEAEEEEEADGDAASATNPLAALQALLMAIANPNSSGSTSPAEQRNNVLTLQALLQSGQLSAETLRRLGFVLTTTRADGSQARVGADGEEDEEVDDEDIDMDDDEDDEDVLGNLFNRGGRGPFSRPNTSNLAPNGRAKGWDWFPIEYEGKPAGRALAQSGEFGRAGYPPMEDRSGKGGVKRRRRSSSGASPATEAGPGAGRRRGSSFGSLQPLSTSPQATMGGLPSAQSPGNDRGPARRTSYGFSGMPGGDAPLSSSSALSTSPQATRNIHQSSNKSRRLTGSSTYSSVTQREDKVRGIREKCRGRGPWAVGQSGWKRDFARGVWGGSGREEWNRYCLPNSNGTIVATYDHSPYIGQHSHDSTFFYTATQDFKIHLYSTQDAPKIRDETGGVARSGRMVTNRYGRRYMDYDENSEDSSLREIKKVTGVHGNWTVTDADLSRDNQWMIYSSINPQVHIFRTAEHEDEHQQLDFAERGDGARRGIRSYWGNGHFGIWSVRLSADAKEIVAGCGSGQIMVYDIERKKRTLSIGAHRDDVNGVCFADDSTNILISGSDDGYVKVWDRRSLAAETPAGVLAGHTEGITYVSPKGDGRYVCSNGKDQTIRLWDLRKMISHSDISRDPDAASTYGLSGRGWDYKDGSRYSKPLYPAHPKDCSVMQYRGHRVTKTLIRCHFSPVETTGAQYIYTGGSNGIIYIYALDGRIVQVLDRSKATRMKSADGSYNDLSAPVETPTVIPDATMVGSFGTVVRDVSWSVDQPSMISTAWESTDMSRSGNVAVHEWRGLGKGGLNRLEDWVELDADRSEGRA